MRTEHNFSVRAYKKKTRTEPKGTEAVTFGTTLTEPNPKSKGSAARILQSLFHHVCM